MSNHHSQFKTVKTVEQALFTPFGRRSIFRTNRYYGAGLCRFFFGILRDENCYEYAISIWLRSDDRLTRGIA